MNNSATLDCLACPAYQSSVFVQCDQRAMRSVVKAKSELHRGDGDLIDLEATSTGVFCLRSGEVEVFRAGSRGEPRMIYTVGPGAILGCERVFEGTSDGQLAACAATSSLCFIPAAALLALVKKQPQVLLAIMRRLCKQLSDLDKVLSIEGSTGAAITHCASPPTNRGGAR